MLVLVAAAGASTKVSNGNFERGDLSDWSTDSTGGGAWDVYQGNETTNLSIPFYRPPQGTWAAAAEEFVPSRNALYRTIGLGSNKTQQISFYVYYQNSAATSSRRTRSTGSTSSQTGQTRCN